MENPKIVQRDENHGNHEKHGNLVSYTRKAPLGRAVCEEK
jgi:hypothetical protein